MSIAKSDLIKELANSYPNFLRKDLVRLIDIILYEMTNSLKRSERVELRDIFTIEPKIQKSGSEEIQKMEKFLQKKRKIFFKMSKKWSKIINEK